MECYKGEFISKKTGVLKPILMIDEERIWFDTSKAISECIMDKSYPFWDYHFEGNPVMPGCYMIEMLAQSAAFFEMMLVGCENVPIITSVTNARFLREIKPGAKIFAEIELKKSTGNYYTTQGKIICEEKPACRAEMVHYIKAMEDI